MAISARIDPADLAGFQRAIQRLTDRHGPMVGRRAMIQALTAAAEPMREIAEARTGVRTGRLRRSVRVTRGRGRSGRYSVLIGYRSAALRYNQMRGAEYGNKRFPAPFRALRAASREGLPLARRRFGAVWRPIVERAARGVRGRG